MPLYESPISGSLGVNSASIYLLDAAAITPVSLVADVVPSYDEQRSVLDMVDSEQWENQYQVTDNVLQDLTNVQSNIFKTPRSLNISGIFANTLPSDLLGSIGLDAIPGFSSEVTRNDIVRYNNLVAIADKREPVAVITPRGSIPVAAIMNVRMNWEPKDGESINITISVKALRVALPSSGENVLPDVESSYTGNNAVSNAGSQSASEVDTTVTDSGITGVPPTIG